MSLQGKLQVQLVHELTVRELLNPAAVNLLTT